MDARLKNIVTQLRRSNPPSEDVGLELQEAIVNAGLKQEVDESDIAEAADELGVDPGDLIEEMASWL
jgi:hypothetical protein